MSARERVGWVGELVRPRAAPVPWSRALRTAVAVVVPVSLGSAAGQLGIGLLCSIGALAASLVDNGGPYRGRAARVGAVAAAGTLGFALGGLANGNPVLTPLFVLTGGVVAGIVSVFGNVASVASLQFLIYLIVAGGANFGPGPEWLPPLLYLVGAMWALALTLAGGIGRRTAPERAAVAAVFRSLAELMEASGGSGVEQARLQLTQAMNAAYDSVVTYRAGEAGRDPRTRRLAAVLNASTPIVEAVIGVTRERTQVPTAVIGLTREIAAAVREGAYPEGRRGRGARGRLGSVRAGSWRGEDRTRAGGGQPDPRARRCRTIGTTAGPRWLLAPPAAADVDDERPGHLAAHVAPGVVPRLRRGRRDSPAG